MCRNCGRKTSVAAGTVFHLGYSLPGAGPEATARSPEELHAVDLVNRAFAKPSAASQLVGSPLANSAPPGTQRPARVDLGRPDDDLPVSRSRAGRLWLLEGGLQAAELGVAPRGAFAGVYGDAQPGRSGFSREAAPLSATPLGGVEPVAARWRHVAPDSVLLPFGHLRRRR
jgi:hypothetical protein